MLNCYPRTKVGAICVFKKIGKHQISVFNDKNFFFTGVFFVIRIAAFFCTKPV